MQLEHHVNARELVPQTVGAPAFFRMSEVIRITALSRATVYRRIAEGKFPPPIHIGVRTCRWPRAALQQWIEDPESYSNTPESPMA